MTVCDGLRSTGALIIAFESHEHIILPKTQAEGGVRNRAASRSGTASFVNLLGSFLQSNKLIHGGARHSGNRPNPTGATFSFK